MAVYWKTDGFRACAFTSELLTCPVCRSRARHRPTATCTPPAQAPRAASRPPARVCLRATRVRRPVRPREPAVGRALAVVVRRGVDPALAVAVVALGRRACGGGSVTVRSETGRGAHQAAELATIEVGARRYPKLQLRSVENLLLGQLPSLPDMADPCTGKRVRQGELFEQGLRPPDMRWAVKAARRPPRATRVRPSGVP